MKRSLQIVLLVLVGIMTVAGLQGVLGGASTVLGGNEHSPNVDSEFRFYSVWYAAMGVMLLRAIRRVETAAFEVRMVGAGFFLAALGRLLSIGADGSPHGYYIALMVIEFLIPIVIVPWQAVVAKRAVT
jgi:hypothetical protein